MRSFIIIIFSLLTAQSLFSQVEKKDMRLGNRLYGKDKFIDSEVRYRKALEKNPNSVDAMFNLGDALYKQGKHEEAANLFNSALPLVKPKEQREKLANTLYNLGNSLVKANKLEEGIQAYKNSLRANPNDMDAKYNLAYALKMKKKNDQNKKNDKNKNQDKNDNKDNKQDKNQNKNDQDNKQQQSPKQKISKDDAERILNALQNNESKVQEKAKENKGQPVKVKVLKNW